jgi:hypothetical protein
VGALGKVTGKIWLADPYEDHISVTQQAGCIDDHQLGGRIIRHGIPFFKR